MIFRKPHASVILKHREPRTFISEYGMTLIETLIALAVAGVVTGGLISAFIAQQGSYKTQMVTSALQQNMRISMKMITDDIRSAG